MTAEETLAKIRTLFERDEAKRVLVAENRAICPVCKNDELYGQEEDWHYPFCPICGQRLKWWLGAIEAARGNET
ncbi:MAG: hypothetical protein LUD72_11255 [Bacteroidales bacterium]|nr:hypothetical protein [Bacteroidales bacterium]